MTTHDCSECTRCQESNYCRPCIDYHKRIELSSENKDIDSLINECAKINDKFEWIPFERFANVKYLARGGFGTIYKAAWWDGPFFNWDHKENKFKRHGEREVVLKSLQNSKQITSEFIKEVKMYHFSKV